MSYYLPIVSWVVSFLVIWLILHSGLRSTVQDVPNARSLHAQPVPRSGGVAIMLGIVAGWWSAWSALPLWIGIPFLALIGLSLLDDVRGLSVKVRLPVHLAAAGIAVWGSALVETQGWVLAGLAFVVIVWMTNLYNFMDGSDGLAGGMALFGFAGYAIGALLNEDVLLATLDFAIAAAAASFLCFNFHPARIFMGDAGSIPLGFLAATLGMWGWLRGDWPMWFPVLVFSPFIVDATITLIRRGLRGAKITEAHREHYYQRAIQLGLGHRNLALLEYVLMATLTTLALLFRQQPLPWPLLAGVALLYSVLMRIVDRRWAQR